MRLQHLSNPMSWLELVTAPERQPLLDRALVTLVARLVESLVHAIGKVSLGAVRAVVVMGVLVALAVPKALRTGERGVAQVQRHFGVDARFDGCLRTPERGGGAVALRRSGQIRGGVGERELRLGYAD